jgi:hypothetical protein
MLWFVRIVLAPLETESKNGVIIYRNIALNMELRVSLGVSTDTYGRKS